MELMTRKQIAEMFRVSIQTIGAWEKKKIIQSYCNVNGRPRYSKAEINKLINQKRG